ncbi:MAG: siphovirus ReqiPepy6 Gp37-like family protein [Nitrospira sp.]|nr:siphovirus ReqiPepy6 Gp37-like family protein [Nitrospira sp.]
MAWGTGSLSISSITSSSFVISYSCSNLRYQGLIEVIDVATHGASYTKRWLVGTGSPSGSITVTGLQPSTQYRAGLHDWQSDSNYKDLAFQSATTSSGAPPPPPSPSGSLTAQAINHQEIDLSYSYSNGSNVSLFRGDTLVKTFGSGSGSGIYKDTGLVENTSYNYYLRNGNLSTSAKLAQATAKTLIEPTGNLSGKATSPYSVELTYSYEDGTNVSLFNGDTLIITLGSGTGSGTYEVTGLVPNVTYDFYLRNGTTPESTELGHAPVATPLPGVGTLSLSVKDAHTIDIDYTFEYGTDVSIFRNGERIRTVGIGELISGSGVYRDISLATDTLYEYKLINGLNLTDMLLAESSARTLKEPRVTAIEQGKLLPLSSKIYIFDSDLNLQGILEDYESLEWNFRYRQVDDFTLVINRYKPNTEYLIKGNILALYVAGYYRASLIEKIEISLTQEGKISENYTISGRGLDSLLTNRVAMHNTDSGTGYDSQDTYAETAMRHFVNVNCIDCIEDTDRNYSNLYLDVDLNRGGNVKYDARFQILSELLEEISLASGLGWGIVLDIENKRFIFQVLQGLDRSFGNGENSTVMFSPKYGNIKLLSYMNSNIGSFNVAYVAGQGEANLRAVQKITKGGETYSGLLRRETFIDARDLDTTDKLIQRGNERLAELGEEETLEMENLSTGPFKFGEDFVEGDIVTVEYPDIVAGEFRVVESKITITPNEGIQNNLILGKSSPDFVRLYKLNNKNFNTEVRR